MLLSRSLPNKHKKYNLSFALVGGVYKLVDCDTKIRTHAVQEIKSLTCLSERAQTVAWEKIESTTHYGTIGGKTTTSKFRLQFWCVNSSRDGFLFGLTINDSLSRSIQRNKYSTINEHHESAFIYRCGWVRRLYVCVSIWKLSSLYSDFYLYSRWSCERIYK